jgi:hypothetical protein
MAGQLCGNSSRPQFLSVNGPMVFGWDRPPVRVTLRVELSATDAKSWEAKAASQSEAELPTNLGLCQGQQPGVQVLRSGEV